MTTPDAPPLCRECATVALCLVDGCSSKLPDAMSIEIDIATLRTQLDTVTAHRDRLATAVTTSESERDLMEATAVKLGDDVDALTTARDEATQTLAELAPAREPDTALTDLRATVKRLTAEREHMRDQRDYLRAEVDGLAVIQQGNAAEMIAERNKAVAATEALIRAADEHAADYVRLTAERDEARKELDKARLNPLSAGLYWSNRAARMQDERDAALADAAEAVDLLRNAGDEVDRWRKRAKRRKWQLGMARDSLEVAQQVSDRQCSRVDGLTRRNAELLRELARMSPVVEAAEHYAETLRAFVDDSDISGGTIEKAELRLMEAVAAASLTVGQTLITDLGSTNGTWIEHNGKQTRAVGPTPIFPGCTLVIGRTRIPWKANNDGY